MSALRAFTSPACLLHDPADFPERRQRLEGILAALATAGVDVVEVGTHPDSPAAIEAVHDPRYVARFRRAVERGDGLLDSPDNPLTPHSWTSAVAAVDVALYACDWLMDGRGRRAFAAVRPPGHHAERDRAMGFCYFNNVAVVARHLRDRHRIGRLAIFDFDVHHGNGTQHLFEESPDVFFASTHQFPFYPGTGASSERGRGAGEGSTLNAPLPAGTDDRAYGRVLEEAILPALNAFRPEVLLVSAGFDAWRGDPLGGLCLTEASYERLGRELAAVAQETAGDRVLAALEGGYDLEALGGLVASFLRALA